MLPRKSLWLLAPVVISMALFVVGLLPLVGALLAVALVAIELGKVLALVAVIRRLGTENVFGWIMAFEGLSFLLAVVLALALVPADDGLAVPLTVGLVFVASRVLSGLVIGDCFSEKK